VLDQGRIDVDRNRCTAGLRAPHAAAPAQLVKQKVNVVNLFAICARQPDPANLAP
jgi:hypothetical protein